MRLNWAGKLKLYIFTEEKPLEITIKTQLLEWIYEIATKQSLMFVGRGGDKMEYAGIFKICLLVPSSNQMSTIAD